MTSDPTTRKAALRRAALERRDAVEPGARAAFASKLAREADSLFGPLGSGAVALYAPIRNEPDCAPLLAALHAAGRPIVLPAVLGPGGTPLAFRAFRPGDLLRPGSVGKALEPATTRVASPPAIVVTPGAAFDRTGHRIGFGRGYYDATLAALRAQGRLFALGLAFACQEVEAIPFEPHDERLDAVVTEREIIICTINGKALDAAALHW